MFYVTSYVNIILNIITTPYNKHSLLLTAYVYVYMYVRKINVVKIYFKWVLLHLRICFRLGC